jgi:hypothetical protein
LRTPNHSRRNNRKKATNDATKKEKRREEERLFSPWPTVAAVSLDTFCSL